MGLPRVRLELSDDYLPLPPLRALMAELAPMRTVLLERWSALYVKTFGTNACCQGDAVAPHLAAELDLLLGCEAVESLADLWTRLQETGRRHADRGVPYGELVISIGLLEECMIAELAERGASAEARLSAAMLFDKLAHFHITKLAEAYFYRYVELIQDKTRELAEEQERSEWNMMRAEKLAGLGQLAGGVAHELNNPLATISITVEDLQDALRLEAKEVPKKWPELAPALERIRTSVGRCIGIIGAMLDLARNRPPTIEEFGVNELVRRVTSVTAWPAHGTRKQLALELDDGLGSARSDPRQLEQVLMALISNAMDAIGDGGTVMVRTRKVDDHFAVEVEDDGCGIPPELMSRVMEPFFTTKPPGKGTGLGLSMAYSTVKRLKGKLTLESAPGMGTRARVLLPVANRDVGPEKDR